MLAINAGERIRRNAPGSRSTKRAANGNLICHAQLMKYLGKPIDFIVCGTQKGGTTALDSYLRDHPGICMATPKEVHFFDNEEYFRNSAVDYSRYHQHFQPKAAGLLRGEATPIYMYWKSSPSRIWEYNRNIKLILVLRNPIERAYSHWNMETSRSAETLPFFDAIRVEAERCRSALPLQHRIHSYLDRGFYTEQLKRIWHFFPKDQTLVIRSEDLKHTPASALEVVSQFLGINYFPQVEKRDVHLGKYSSAISIHEFNYLRQVFQSEIMNLQNLLDWDCSNWLIHPGSQEFRN